MQFLKNQYKSILTEIIIQFLAFVHHPLLFLRIWQKLGLQLVDLILADESHCKRNNHQHLEDDAQDDQCLVDASLHEIRLLDCSPDGLNDQDEESELQCHDL
jgi:hypothetical protein